MTLPFHSVTSPTDQQTHLVLHTPAMPGHRPDQLPHITLCRRLVADPTTASIGDVECERCLHATVDFMALPAFGVHQ
ncbi:hypothetical protein [Klenkia sp. PcliD-1-E]|jgi:hypothetical protein|uniref:hypothetical protein n=1 Tax=Klenkia sp. PcliD-1-E TaxID=2954492 RepID=UPI002097F899|nr:hypothetical protein [Klenkia sp. PcliD-1-E]MCO7221552.1 hypothetical protein [Klenkia sp. PcliD-1-E]